jgi:hypothetical protein
VSRQGDAVRFSFDLCFGSLLISIGAFAAGQTSMNVLRYEKMTALMKLFPGAPIQVGSSFLLQGEQLKVIGVDSFHLKPADKVVLLARTVELASAPEQKNLFAGTATQIPTVGFAGKNAILVGTSTEDLVYAEGATYDSPAYELKNWYQLPETQALEVKGPGNQKQTIPLKEFTAEMEKHVDEVTAWSNATPRKMIAHYERLKKWDTHQSFLFNMTPVKSHVYTFKLGNGSATHEIKVSAPKSRNSEQDQSDLLKIRNLLERTPTALEGYIEAIHFDPGENGAGLAASTTPVINGKNVRQLTFYLAADEPEVSVVSDILKRPLVEETYWHELGHDLQAKVPSLIPNFMWAVWEDAIVKDAAWVTPYSMTSTSEDFPETLARYIRTDAGRTDPQIRKLLAHRFGLLDQIFLAVRSH